MMVRSSIILSALGKGLFLLFILISTTACNGSAEQADQNEVVKAPTQSIHEAALMGNLKAINEHIKAGTDLNLKDPYGSSSLTISTLFGKTDIALALVNAGADITIKGADGSTPLHTAAFLCRTEIVESLLKKGVAVDDRNSFGMTALESVMLPFQEAKMIYDQMGKDLGPLGLKLDYERLETTRPLIAGMIQNHK